MAKSTTYKHNSEPKNFIRDKWIEFATDTYQDATHDFGILTFPAEAMQDLHLFKENGFINWEEVETASPDGSPNFKITKGNVRCFEKNMSIYKAIRERLVSATVLNTDFCGYITSNYTTIMSGKDKTFPVDVVNLDFEGRLYPNNRYPFDNTVKCIFEFQKAYKRNFSLFVTWPVVEDQDILEYKELLYNTIESNLQDPSAVKFKSTFEESFDSIDTLEYERKSVIGIAKVIIKKASQNLYTLTKSEFYVYGEGGGVGRQRMLSLLFNFKFDGRTGKENIIYSNDVINAMLDLITVDN